MANYIVDKRHSLEILGKVGNKFVKNKLFSLNYNT